MALADVGPEAATGTEPDAGGEEIRPHLTSVAVGLKASYHFRPGGGGGSGRSDEEPASPSLGSAAVAVTTVLLMVTTSRQGMVQLTDGTPPTVMTAVVGGEGREEVVVTRLSPEGGLAPREEPIP
ncbi:hypothetical protein E2562_024483 [Oryza meyeriana var. granulata]|uniref:Uncharacterized protein n=1 Tax=Oryza meyeriana var. granulata TaxID=110450 RepID=A0A6G1FBU0_9ORYZ|nr:hypothetical protein E2562_024483 [Oryza meyeriana var. granulata]